MGIELLKKAYSDYLNTLNIHVLRNVARHVGVYKPTEGKKDGLIDRTISVLIGTVAPVPPSKLGAPLKEDTLDPKYMRELERIREEYMLTTGQSDSFQNVLGVRSEEEKADEYSQPLYMGVLELLPNGCGYLRVENCQPTDGKDVFISSQNVRAWSLKEGDYVVGHATWQSGNNNPTLVKVLSVNAAMQYQSRKNFEDFSASYPEEKISLSASSNQPSLRYLDLFSPIGKGQRVLVSAPPCTGATTLLKDIALSVQAKIDQGENLHLLALLIAERPEEVTEFCRTVSEEVVYTTFDQEAQEHLRAARLVFSRAKRLAEMGEDVVLLLDSLTRLTLAADACAPTGKTLPCGLEIGAFQFPRTCLSQARKLKGGGSITVIATVACGAGNEVEQVICSEFEKICNGFISLSATLSAKRIFPAIDVKNSYTRRAEVLLTPEEAECAAYVRQNLLDDNGEVLHELIDQTPDNATLIKKILNK